MKCWIAFVALGCSAHLPTAELDDLARTALAERGSPGLSIVIQRGDEIVMARGFGVADPAAGVPATPETVFQLGSISKQFLAAMVLRLNERGLVALDEPIAAQLPGFEHLPRAITVRTLLNHTAGIRDYFTMPEYWDGVEDLERPAADIVPILRRASVDFSPGSRWSYSNVHYMILALLVEYVTGVAYEEALTAEWFRPLGLSSLRHCPSVPDGRGQAVGHWLEEGETTPAPPENMAWVRGDGGLCGNALDVARWTRSLATGRVLEAESLRRLTTATSLPNGTSADYGFGLSLVPLEGRRKVSHNGATRGFSASVAYYPDGEWTIVVLANRGDVRTESIERSIARRILQLPSPAWTERPLSTSDAARFAGDYDIGVFTVRIVHRRGRLWLEMPPPGPTTALRHLGNAQFVSNTDPDATQLTFEPGETLARRVRLLMGAMHWYGTRIDPPPVSSPSAGAPPPRGAALPGP